MSHRLKRVEEAIRRELGALINRHLVFEEGMVTIHDVSVAPDLRQCHIYLGVVPNTVYAGGVLQKLEENRSMLQTGLSQRVVLKYTPHLHFHLDDSIERGVRVLQIMDEIPAPLSEEPQGDKEDFDDENPDDFVDEDDADDWTDTDAGDRT